MPRALIVDDNQSNLYLLHALLAGSGYETVSATNGAEALVEARRNRVDLIISDILMPVMDGFSLCRAWKQDAALRHIPFIFYTATYTDAKDEQFALSLGADAFIIKPMDPFEFIQTVSEILEKHRQGESLREDPAAPSEAEYLREYNAALIRKLEGKIIELNRQKQQLIEKDFAIASAISAIAITDARGRLTYANRALIDLLGYAEPELVGMDVRGLVDDQAALGAVVTDVRTRGRWLGELRLRRKDGTSFPAHGAIHVVRDERGKPVSIMASCFDITERKRNEERLRLSQRLESMGIFAAGISHDFNNILGAICCNLELAGMALPAGSPAGKYLATINDSCDVAKDLLHRLAVFARGEHVPGSIIDVADCLDRAAGLSLTGSPVRFELTVGGRPRVVGDEAQIMQLFSNLLINSRQAMPDGGRILASAVLRRLGGNEVEQLPEGVYAEIVIADEGSGVPEQLVAKIFDPFFTTKLEGSGLGLAICFSIVRGHGGHINVVSKEGAGARFTILLPAAVEESPGAPPGP
jgi:two-component system cell cycle sensor histidine kinase/response regulator CckA